MKDTFSVTAEGVAMKQSIKLKLPAEILSKES